MNSTFVYDCEFLAIEGSLHRFWVGPEDPDPILVQIGVAEIGLEQDYPILDTLRLYVTPRDRFGKRIALDPYLTQLTGITNDQIDSHGLPLAQALERLKDFAKGGKLWSWGKDELNMVAISCYAAGIAPMLPATQFGNIRQVFLGAGMPPDDLRKTSSGRLADYYQIDHPPFFAHDALDDALSIAYALQHQLRLGKIAADDLT
ncbi:exonuclease [Thioclava sp. FR2]|uniref:exonuclease n=1 Tax=Thioclava sp. FR2 TaxID=3445780 RepID=UPI003EBB2644